MPKICNINFWIENDPPLPLEPSEKSADLVAPPFRKRQNNLVNYIVKTKLKTLQKYDPKL